MSAREWKSGDVALIRVGTGDWELGLLQDNGEWVCQHASIRREHETVSISGPLTIIDPEDTESIERLYSDYVRRAGIAYISGNRRHMQAALREFANPTLPKPPEPPGIGAVVEDVDGAMWTRWNITGMAAPWRRDHNKDDGRALHSRYADIAAVKVLSEGVPQ